VRLGHWNRVCETPLLGGVVAVLRDGSPLVVDVPHPVPVLLYHRVTESPSAKLAPFTVPPALFGRHLDLLDELGFEVLPVSALVPAMAGGDGSRRLAAVTFDDGYADFASDALPHLLRRGMAATMYVTTGWLDGRPGTDLPRPSDPFLSWSQLAELRDAGTEIGGHSHSHPQMDTLSPAAIRDELVRCTGLLEEALSERIRSFAYPHGYNDRRVRRSTREAGYESATAVANRLARPGVDLLRIPRLMLGPWTTVPELRRLLAERPAGPSRSAARAGLTVGWRTYRRAKAVLTRRPGRDTW
jgi:peptidoglycan/xylan/chitin deacetylase (PgdA/CDA1 family)